MELSFFLENPTFQNAFCKEVGNYSNWNILWQKACYVNARAMGYSFHNTNKSEIFTRNFKNPIECETNFANIRSKMYLRIIIINWSF